MKVNEGVSRNVNKLVKDGEGKEDKTVGRKARETWQESG